MGFGTFLPGDDVAGAIYRSQLSELVVGGAQSTIDELDAARQDLDGHPVASAEHAQQKAAQRRQAAQLASRQLAAAMSLSQR